MKKLHALLVALMLVFLTACGMDTEPKPIEKNKGSVSEQSSDSAVEDSYPVTLKDATDKEIEIEKKPEKIVSLIPSNTEIVYALGEGDTLVGVSESDNYPKEVNEIEKVAGMELNIEKILSLAPDVVLAHASTVGMWESGLKQLEDSGVTVFVVNDAQSFDEIYTSIEMVGKVTGQNEEAKEMIADMKSKLSNLKEKAKTISEKDRKSVFIEVGSEPEIYTTGTNSFMSEMLEVINADNAVTEQGDWIPLNEEAIVKLNPDVILITYGQFVENAKKQLMERNAWQDMTAIKEEKVYEVNDDLVSRPGPRVVEGVEELAKSIYPDVFGK